jgi:hypothetical protein
MPPINTAHSHLPHGSISKPEPKSPTFPKTIKLEQTTFCSKWDYFLVARTILPSALNLRTDTKLVLEARCLAVTRTLAPVPLQVPIRIPWERILAVDFSAGKIRMRLP